MKKHKTVMGVFDSRRVFLLFLILGILFFPSSLFGSQFVKTLGGTNDDWAGSLIPTSDGGLIVTGGTYSFGAGNLDLFLTKFTASGNHLWTKTLGGTNVDVGYSVIQTSDGGFVVTGYTESFGAGGEDLLLAKFDATGNHLWTRTLGGSSKDIGEEVIEAFDHGLVVTGKTYSFGAGSDDILLAKFDANGNYLWAKTLGGGSSDRAHALTHTSDGGFVVTGWTYSFGAGGMDIPLAKFDANGNLLWTRTLGGSGWDYGSSVIQTSDSGLVITGWTSSFGVEIEDVLLAKFDASGNHLWTKTLGGSSNDVSYSVIQTSDGGFVITGDTKSFGAVNWDLLEAKFGTDGNFIQARTLGGGGNDGSRCVMQTPDLGLIVAGYTESFGTGGVDLLLAKFDADGNTCIGDSVFPDTTSPDPTITSPDPDTSSPDPTITSPAPTITSPDPTLTIVCSSLPVFKAHFMTADSIPSPYPFDIIISDGEWVQEFDSVTYLETEVPDTATYTYTYHMAGNKMMNQFALPLSSGKVKEVEFLAIALESLSVYYKPHVLFREKGANDSIAWQWHPEIHTLACTTFQDSGQLLDIGWLIDDNILEAPIHAIDSIITLETTFPTTYYAPDGTTGDNTCVRSKYGTIIVFHGPHPDSGAIHMANVLSNHSIIPCHTSLISIDGIPYEPTYRAPQFIIPSEENYILTINGLPEEFLQQINIPLNISEGRTETFNVYYEEKETYSHYTFSVLAEFPLANSSYSGLFHYEDSLSADVGTEFDADWWGYFVLPVLNSPHIFSTFSPYPAPDPYDTLEQSYDFIPNFADVDNDGYPDFVLLTTRIDPDVERLALEYTLRGDANGDKVPDIVDVVYVVNYLFKDGSAPNPLDKADVNCDGEVTISDVVRLINYLWKNGPPPCRP